MVLSAVKLTSLARHEKGEFIVVTRGLISRVLNCLARAYVKRNKLQPFNEVTAAANKIQSAARMRLAKHAARRERNWQMFNMLDAQDENVRRPRTSD